MQANNNPELSVLPDDRKIGTDQDSQGNALDIWFAAQLCESRVFPLVLRTFAELFERDLSRKLVTWSETNRYKAVYAVDPATDQVLGGIAFEFFPTLKEGWIDLSFTAPEARGRRINQVMHRYFERAILKMGGTRIGSYVHVNNEARLRASERVGFRPVFYRMEKILDPKDYPNTEQS